MPCLYAIEKQSRKSNKKPHRVRSYAEFSKKALAKLGLTLAAKKQNRREVASAAVC